MAHRTQSNLTLNPSITALKKLSLTNNQLSPRSLSKRPPQSIVSVGRESTSFKLPALLKRTPTTSNKHLELKSKNIREFFVLVVKPIASAYIQDASYVLNWRYAYRYIYVYFFRQLQLPSSSFANRTVLQPTPVLPIFTPHRSVTLYAEQKHLPLIKDRMVKANLSQRATFKSKSPLPYRPESSLSRSTTAIVTASQLQTKTYNPLKVLTYIFD